MLKYILCFCFMAFAAMAQEESKIVQAPLSYCEDEESANLVLHTHQVSGHEAGKKVFVETASCQNSAMAFFVPMEVLEEYPGLDFNGQKRDFRVVRALLVGSSVGPIMMHFPEPLEIFIIAPKPKAPDKSAMRGVVFVSDDCKLGDIGCGHMKWHESFYSKLKRDRDKFPCCNMTDCRPTVLQEVGGQLFILADGKWLPYEVKYKATPKPQDYPADAQDVAHVCAAQTMVQGAKVPVPYCYVLPNGM